MSHATRAYMVNTEGLRNFLVKESPVMIKIKEAHTSGRFLDVIRR